MNKEMIKVDKVINLSQLDSELNSKGLVAELENNKIVSIGLADDNDATINQLISAIENHKAIDEIALKEQRRQEILNRLGITDEEAKILLS